MTVAGHAYPWDVLGDPEFAGRAADHGFTRITLAAAYHSTRAATPLHPVHQVVDVPYAALYRPVRDKVWAGRRLRPRGLGRFAETDPFGAAATTLRTAGLAVGAWIVLTHNTRLGSLFPQLSVVNCVGDRYPYALCPAREEVRDYAALLAAEAIRDTAVDAVSLEACGQLGIVHLGHHEKTDGAWTPEAQRLLSVCCCAACRQAWRRAGLDPAEVVAGLRAELAGTAGARPAWGWSEKPAALAGTAGLDDGTAAALLAHRHAAADQLRRQVVSAVRDQRPDLHITLHAHPDPWATGSSPGLTPAAADEVDAVLVPAWPTGTASADLVAATARRAATVDAYLTVLPPAEPDAVVEHGRRLVAAGADRLSLYHLGLAPAWRQPLFAQLISALAGADSGGHP